MLLGCIMYAEQAFLFLGPSVDGEAELSLDQPDFGRLLSEIIQPPGAVRQVEREIGPLLTDQRRR